MERRTLKILEAIVDEYIRTGVPVGSKTVQEKLDISVSSATIRNEMALLEKEGYLEHPHTSAGRVPTFNGYRLYIEKFTPESRLTDEQRDQLDKIFEGIDGTDEEIIEGASRALAEVTRCAIVTTNETSRFSVITKVEVIPTGKRLYVLLLITSGGNIKNRVCRLSFDLSNEQVAFFQRFVNENLQGLNLESLSEDYLDKISTALGSYMVMLSPLMKGVADLSAELLREEVHFQGESNLIACEELESREIATLLSNRNQFTEILSNAFSGINIMFGEENDSFVVSNSSIITGSFTKDGKKAGSFGVIGPMRLDYKKVIPYIEYFSNKVTRLLSVDENEELIQIEEKEAAEDEQQAGE